MLAVISPVNAYRYFAQPIRSTGTRAEMVLHPRQHRIAMALAAGLLASLLSASLPAQSQPPQYITTVWQTEQGLPQNSVNAILQDHRGYLWIGTFGGLARFDGERFKVFDSGGTPGFGNNQILSLYESRSGTLWIGTEDGLIRLENGVATTDTERDGLPGRFIQSIRGDAEGDVWIKTSHGLAKFAGAKLEAYPTHQGKAVREFYLQARDGSMWFRCGTDLVRFGADGSLATLQVRNPSVFLVQEARDGSVWVAVRDEYRLVRYYQGVFSDVSLPPIGRRALAKGHDPEFDLTMAQGADGELLLYTPAGLIRIVDGRLSPPEPLLLPADGGELPKVRSLLVDREGNLWVGMVGPGLLRLRPAPLTAYAKAEGLSDSSFNTVFQDREGRVWLGGDLLYWFDGHRFHLIPGLQDILALAQTREGDLWFGGYGGLYRWRSGVLSHFNVEASAVGSIYQDPEGTLWIGGTREARAGGLYRFREGKLDQIPGISGVQQIIEDRDGGFWVVAIEGLSYVRGGKAVPYYQNRSLPGHISDIYQDSTGTLWLATYGGGLFRLRDGRLKAITTKDGLPNNMLLRLLEDGKENLWFSSTQGIFRLSLKELNDFAEGRISSLLPVTYGVAEGMRSSECNGGSPGGWKTSDGRIWFPTIRGVVAIDPAAGSRLPPPVVLEEASANKLTLALDSQTSVHPPNDTFDFRFTALSFSAPDKLRFRYRLEPFDKDWVDAGTRRTAHYTNMAPGKYSFQVAAANDYGIWNQQGASVRFVLRPHFYQTKWFYALGAAMFLAMLGAAYQFRVRQLQKESKQLRDVIDTIPGYVWSARPDGSLDFINRRWLDFSGVSLEEALGRGWEAAVHPDDLAKFVDEWRAAVAGGKALETEARIHRADGQYRWLLIRNVPLHDKRGKIVKWYGTSTDINDRKQAEDALRRSQAYLTEAQLLSRTGSFGWKPSIGEIQWSEETYRIFQYDLSTKPTVELVLARVHPQDRALTQQIIRSASQEQKDFEHEYRLLIPDGSVKYLHIMAHALRDESGGLEFVGAVMDVTAATQAEERVRQSEAELRQLIDAIPQQVFVFDADWSPLFASRRELEYTGLTAQEAQSKDAVARIFHPEDLKKLEALRERMRSEGVPSEMEARIRGKDGQYRWFLIRDNPLREEHGRVLRWYGTRTDIEERKQAEEALRQAQTELAHVTRIMTLGELAASIAHEVNQPLSGVVVNANACLRWLAGDSPNLEEGREAVRRIVRDGKRAGDVIARIRALATKTATAKERLDVNEAIGEVMVLAGDELRKNSVAVRTEFAPDLLPALGDRVQIQQVVLNLVMNGIEAMSGVEERPRELIVRTQNDEGDQVRVTVQDSGVGLDPQALERIFEAFYTTKQRGMGMGLSISRSIIQNHGGKLWAVANGGPGTSVQFTIPKYQQ